MNRVNYQKELDKILEALEKEYAGSAAVKSEADEQHGAKAQRSPAERRGPDERCGRVSEPDFAPVRKKLLLHSCCAPCSSYVLEYLSRYFDITVFYYNPNITQRGEYDRRVEEQGRLIRLMNEEKERTSREEGKERPCVNGILLEKGAYESERFFELAKGLEDVPEGGERCRRCYWLRLSETARLAALGGYDYFTTTLTISPMKNAGWLNEIGEQLAEAYHTSFLPSDFKKKNGYKRSVELSEQYGLYRQDYCGCIFSKMERDKRHAQAEERKGKGDEKNSGCDLGRDEERIPGGRI